MLVKFGENDVKSIEDLAGCATDDLIGWSERKDGEATHHAGFLDGIELSRDEAEAMIMQARLKAGWITEADLAPPPVEEAAPRSHRHKPEDRTVVLAYAQDRARDRSQDNAEQTTLDAGPRNGALGTERLCAVTRAVKPVDEMIRFVLGPDGVVPDLKRKLPGRGIWITATRSALADAIARKVFARGFKKDVRVAPELTELTERLLVRAALDALAIAGKAGCTVAGFAKVEAALSRDKVVALIHGADAGSDGVGKLAGTLRQRPDADRVITVTTFSSAQLDLALGRSNVVHAALLAGPASNTFLARFHRLERFRTGKPDDGGHGQDRR
jgi:hypothetical protein